MGIHPGLFPDIAEEFRAACGRASVSVENALKARLVTLASNALYSRDDAVENIEETLRVTVQYTVKRTQEQKQAQFQRGI